MPKFDAQEQLLLFDLKRLLILLFGTWCYDIVACVGLYMCAMVVI